MTERDFREFVYLRSLAAKIIRGLHGLEARLTVDASRGKMTAVRAVGQDTEWHETVGADKNVAEPIQLPLEG